MAQCLTINQIVNLLCNLEESQKRKPLNQLLSEFAKSIGVHDWREFKLSNKVKEYASPKLGITIKIKGNKSTVEDGWSASEIEFALKKHLSTSHIKRIDHIKKQFEGRIVLV
jgi:hypothetical protein